MQSVTPSCVLRFKNLAFDMCFIGMSAAQSSLLMYWASSFSHYTDHQWNCIYQLCVTISSASYIRLSSHILMEFWLFTPKSSQSYFTHSNSVVVVAKFTYSALVEESELIYVSLLPNLLHFCEPWWYILRWLSIFSTSPICIAMTD